MYVLPVYTDGNSSPVSGSSGESSAKEEEHIPEAPHAHGIAVESTDEDSDWNLRKSLQPGIKVYLYISESMYSLTLLAPPNARGFRISKIFRKFYCDLSCLLVLYV